MNTASKIVLSAVCVLLLTGYAETSQAATQEQIDALQPKCKIPTQDGDKACWIQVQQQPPCYVWHSEPADHEKITWHGKCRNGVAHGHAKETGSFQMDGELFKWESEGEYLEGKGNGLWIGRMTEGNLDLLPVYFKSVAVDSKMHGPATLRFADGSTMEGSLVNNRIHGHWIVRNADGTVEEGPYVNDEQHGHWIIRNADGTIDEGPYVNGELHGHWIYRFEDGRIEEGPVVNGKRHGIWTVRLSDGQVFQVKFVHGDLQEEQTNSANTSPSAQS